MPPKKLKTGTNLRAGQGEKIPKTVVSTADGWPAVTFSFRYLDSEFPGPEMTDADKLEVFGFLWEMTRLTWPEIRAQITSSNRGSHKKHHDQDCNTVTSEAQRRLKDRGLEGAFARYFRFRLGNMKRLWGFIDGGCFYVLWWDTGHKVYEIDD